MTTTPPSAVPESDDQSAAAACAPPQSVVMVGAPEGQRPLIREWHTMTAAERAREWSELVVWVVWIHDQYELSKEERLPRCWHQHPGLVEELRSLKAWREYLYDNPEATTNPHAARSWHGELRQTIAAALTFWARGCRTGHKNATLLADTNPALADQWRRSAPPLMASAPRPDPARCSEISDLQMQTALHTGQAERHSQGLPRYAHLAGFWWERAGDNATWTRCDRSTHQRLEDTVEQLRAADAAVTTLNRP